MLEDRQKVLREFIRFLAPGVTGPPNFVTLKEFSFTKSKRSSLKRFVYQTRNYYMIKIALVGDILITRPLPAKGYNGLQELTDLINEHDVKFANLETTIHRREGYPSAFPGGTWAMTDPACLKDLKQLGFNILNTANNHSMDYSHNGLLATHKYLKENDLLFAGTGENLADASAPTFIECSEGRVAVIGATSSFHDSDAAGNQRIDMKGRPGVNPLRHKSIYEVTEENYQNLQKIAAQDRLLMIIIIKL